jgi:uncharacterized protein YkwD/predicted small secreted protein
MRRTALAVAVLAPAILLAACVDTGTVGGIFGRPLAATPGAVDSEAAARLISSYRATRGLPPVAVDQRLTRIAADHARLMATRDRVAHVLPGEGSFPHRIAAGGFVAAVAAENIGGGYKTLDAALAGWRQSPEHDANLLRAGVSKIGIAVFNAPGSTYKTYWSLVLAGPYTRPPGGPSIP